MILVFGNKTRHTHFLCKHGFLMIFHNLKCFPIHSFRGTNYIMHCKHNLKYENPEPLILQGNVIKQDMSCFEMLYLIQNQS